jgi:hypothetical protein
MKHAEGNADKSVEFSHFVEIANKDVYGKEGRSKQVGSCASTVCNETEHATGSNNSSASFR